MEGAVGGEEGARFVFFDWAGTLARKSGRSKKDKLMGRVVSLHETLVALAAKEQGEEGPDIPSVDTLFQEFKTVREDLKQSKGEGESFSYKEVLARLWPVLGLGHNLLVKWEEQLLLCLFPKEESAGLYPGAKEVLQALQAAAVPAGLIRNSKQPEQSMRKRLKEEGVEQFFSVVVMAGDLGVEKPDKLVFLHAVEKAGLQKLQEEQPKSIWYIGNEEEIDAKGANGVGWTSVHVKHTQTETASIASHEIDCLSELLSVFHLA
ncbi:hypothetical protein QOT17_020076 [Balamuthia mandrillaris]